MFMFFFFLILMAGIDFVINGGRPAPSPRWQTARAALRSSTLCRSEHHGPRRDSSATAEITVDGDRAQIVLPAKDKPAWKELVAAVHSTGVPARRSS